LRNSFIELIKPRNIQISKELKISDLKEKILRCVNHSLSGNKLEHHVNIKIYLLNFGLKDKKKETFEMIYAYNNNFKSYNLKADEIVDNETLIEVNFNFTVIIEF
jgi:hypothetical protein